MDPIWLFVFGGRVVLHIDWIEIRSAVVLCRGMSLPTADCLLSSRYHCQTADCSAHVPQEFAIVTSVSVVSDPVLYRTLFLVCFPFYLNCHLRSCLASPRFHALFCTMPTLHLGLHAHLDLSVACCCDPFLSWGSSSLHCEFDLTCVALKYLFLCLQLFLSLLGLGMLHCAELL